MAASIVENVDKDSISNESQASEVSSEEDSPVKASEVKVRATSSEATGYKPPSQPPMLPVPQPKPSQFADAMHRTPTRPNQRRELRNYVQTVIREQLDRPRQERIYYSWEIGEPRMNEADAIEAVSRTYEVTTPAPPGRPRTESITTRDTERNAYTCLLYTSDAADE